MSEASASAATRSRDPRRLAIMASLAVAVVMLVGKFAAYFITGSTAILSDALESVIHLVATGIAVFGLWYSLRPADPDHPYGHGKMAYFASALEGALILIAAVVIIVAAVEALVTGPELQQLGVGVVIIGLLAGVNGVLGYTLVRVGRRHNALILVSNGQHVLTDVWTSVGVVIGVALVWWTNILWLDPVVAMLVGANIIRTGGRLIRASYDGLMERASAKDTEQIAELLARATTNGEMTGWHQLRHRRVNDQMWVEFHLLFPSELTITEAHRRATLVEAAVRDLFPGHSVSVTSHLEPDTHDHPPGAHEPASDALHPRHF